MVFFHSQDQDVIEGIEDLERRVYVSQLPPSTSPTHTDSAVTARLLKLEIAVAELTKVQEEMRGEGKRKDEEQLGSAWQGEFKWGQFMKTRLPSESSAFGSWR